MGSKGASLRGPVGIESSGLTHQEFKATAGYTGTESASILNNALRQGFDTSKYADVIERLDKNMETIKKTTILYRGVSYGFLESPQFGLDPRMSFEELQQNLIGKTFVDKGYMSTTHTPENHYGSTQLKITATPGTKAIWSGNDKEREVVLGRNQKFKVENVYRENPKDSWSRIIIEVRSVRK